ncbi:M50 family metallopeptidase [Sporosarcina sp. Te-1]|uniref:M50 family metallopeptidase n=1 Tax=Sporosarcina sp. Te-1 TaxID=2818390 RepID=UPI001A9D482C|nr:M50 family metallopeptidase [Sporosarcina sp. Te-1]QTD40530.1 M50 family metallopeptidase [Sporosarcina sp. Te-1]
MKEFGSALLGAAIGLLAVLYFIFYPESWSLGMIVSMALYALASFALTVFIHEAGHALFGISQGMKVLNISVGPLVLERHGGKFHFHYIPSSLGYVGRAMMGFSEKLNLEDMRSRLIRYIYGGPLMNIGISILSITAAFSVWHHPFLLIFGLMNFLLGASNLKPATVKSVFTDGLVIQKLKTEPLHESALLMGHQILLEESRNTDVKQWDSALIDTVEQLITSGKDPSATSFLHTINYFHLPKHAEKAASIGHQTAFTRTGKTDDLYADIADISYATALLFTGRLASHPGIENALQSIGTLDAITDTKRNAFLSYIQGDTQNAVLLLKKAIELLGVWHPLYLRGEMEKRLLYQMIDWIEKENTLELQPTIGS